jgi:signal transduction histidine kinase/CheY-like chemotaxis protein
MSAGKAPETAFLSGGGILGGLISGFDWSRTPLGPIIDWPAPLKTTIGLILRSPVPIVTLWGQQGTMIYNDAYSGFAGTRHPSLLGSPVREGWPEVADFNDYIVRTVLSGESISLHDQELTLERSGAPEVVRMDLDYSPVLDEYGEPIGVIAIVVDTSEAAEAAYRLRENERRLQFLDALGKATAKSADADTILAITTRMVGEHMGGTSCAYADMDEDEDGFTIRGDWAAPGAVHIVGHYSLADFGKLAVKNLGAGLPLIVNDNLKELAPEEAATFQSIGIGATICMPLVKEGRLTALMAIHHQTPHVWTADELALITEVTERSWAHIERVRSEAVVRDGERRFREELEEKVAERTAALEQSEKTIRTVFETSYLSQGLLTTDGRVVYVNATSLATINARLEDIVGRYFWETPWFTGTPGMPEKIREATMRVASGDSVEFAMPLQMPEGDQIYEFSMRPALDETGKVIGLVPESIEVTARVRAEQALQQTMKVEAIGNLTGGIAHDFNNLLMAVLGSLEILRKRIPQEKKLLRLVDNAAEGALRGKSLTERMLSFARRQDLKPERVSLAELVRGMAELMERTLGPLVALDIRIDDNLPMVEIDPNQLESALLNLAVNARDAMNGEGPLIISARECIHSPHHGRIKPGHYVCLSVNDRGEGMDEKTLKRATEPFFTTKGIGKGTGLGLSMVHGLAEQSGGMLHLESARGKGTTAEIWLPAAGPARPVSVASIAPSAIRDLSKDSPPLRILIVDDDPLVLGNTAAMLEDLGHETVAVSSGALAREALKASVFDVMVTDHAMPNMTGAQLIKETILSHPQMAIVLATGFAELPAEASAFTRLRKPYSQAELADAVTRSQQGSVGTDTGPALHRSETI